MKIPEEPAVTDLPSSPSDAFALGWRMGVGYANHILLAQAVADINTAINYFADIAGDCVDESQSEYEIQQIDKAKDALKILTANTHHPQ